MSTQELFLFSAVLAPLVLIPIFGYKKNPLYFIIGMQLAFYLGHSLYETYLSFNLYDIDDSSDIKLKAIEAHRDIVFSNGIRSAFVAFLYVITLSTLFWDIQKNKNSGTQQTLRVFLNSSLFYFLLFLGSFIDILMAFSLTATYWRMSIFSLFLVFPFLIKAISLKYPAPKESRGKTSKLTWGMFIFFVLFFAFILYER